MIIEEYDYDTLNKLTERITRVHGIQSCYASDITDEGRATLQIEPKAIGSKGWQTEYPFDMHFYGTRIRRIIKGFGLQIASYKSPKKLEYGHEMHPICVELQFD